MIKFVRFFFFLAGGGWTWSIGNRRGETPPADRVKTFEKVRILVTFFPIFKIWLPLNENPAYAHVSPPQMEVPGQLSRMPFH